MLSRVAENIFWMSRYMERTNNILRSLKYQYLGFQDGLADFSAEHIATVHGVPIQEDTGIDEVIIQIIFDTTSDSSVINNVFRARENARGAQDNINRELWQCLNDLYHQVKDPLLQRQTVYDPISVIDELIKRCMQYYGIINTSVSRSEGFYFLNMGKLIERGLYCLDMLKWVLSGVETLEEESPKWRYFLLAFNGFELYLSKHFGDMNTEQILEQMLHQDNYPNSIHYCWQEISFYADNLYGNHSNETAIALDFTIGKSFSYLKYSAPKKSLNQYFQFLNEIEKNFYDLVFALNKFCFGVNVYIN